MCGYGYRIQTILTGGPKIKNIKKLATNKHEFTRIFFNPKSIIIILMFSLFLVFNSSHANIFLNKAKKAYELSGMKDRVIDKKFGPEITISTPTNNTKVSGTVLIKGTASDNYQVTHVELSINNGKWFQPGYTGSTYSDPKNKRQQILYWEYMLDADSFDPGLITIRACSYDKEKNRSEISIQLNSNDPNLQDTTPPLIYITDPTNKQLVNTISYNIKGTASDNSGISKVEVRLNNGNWGMTIGTTTWDMTVSIITIGTNRIYARAYDFPGNCTTNSIKITNDGSLYVYVGTNGDNSNPGTQLLPLRTIQTGIRKAQENSKQCVFISQGVYQEHIILANGISLLGGFSKDFSQRDLGLTNFRTRLDGTANGRCITGGSITNYTIIEGFVITNGYAITGAGFNLSGCNTNLIIKYNKIIRNIATGGTDYTGGGGFFLNNSSPIICNNTINHNSGSGSSNNAGGGAFYLYSYCSPIIYNNIINHNTSSGAGSDSGGGAFYILSYCSPIIINNTIISNDKQVIYLWLNNTGKLINNIIAGKNASIGICECTYLTSSDITLFSNNCFFEIPGNSFYYDSDTSTYMTNASMMNNMSDISTGNNIVANPLLKLDNIHLSNGSQCIDKGINPQSYTSLPNNDIDGESRPKGSQFDIGADEY